jgi:hypothetical protein
MPRIGPGSGRPQSSSQLRLRQLGIAAAIGIAAGAVNFALFSLHHGGDFVQFRYHASVWLRGADPYAGGYPIMRGGRVVPEPLFYPFPALLVIAPFTLLPVRIATAAFVASSAGVLALGLLRQSSESLPLFLGSGFLVSLVLGQWSPLVTATLLFPALGWLAVIKPNIGLAVTAARPRWFAVIGGSLFLVLTLAIQPNWPAEWVRNLHSMPPHPAPVFLPGGVLLLIALTRWRRWEARLLVAVACVPQLMYFADQLPLWLIPRTRRETMVLSATSMLSWTGALVIGVRGARQPAFSSDAFVLLGVYVPAFVMVLRRPNEGVLPAWLERVAPTLPRSLRGRSGTRSDDTEVIDG